MRDVNGVIFVDKVTGTSSATLLHQVKVLFQAKKAGHTGTLDPLASGMLPICFGEATKFSRFLLQSDKSYRVLAKLGERTDTFDSLGRVICVRQVRFDEIHLKCVLDSFVGKSYQVPPMFSALKYFGRPLYQYARQGVNVIRNSRLINIYKIRLVDWDTRYIELEVFCSTGTYIRSFIDDVGELLGCGAHVISLRRFSIGRFSSKFMVDIKVLKKIINEMENIKYLQYLDSLLYPIDILVEDFPEINVSLNSYRLLKFGQKIKLDKDVDRCRSIDTKLVRMTVGCKKKFFGIGHIVNREYLFVSRLLSF